MNYYINRRSSLMILTFMVLGVYYPSIFAPLNSVDDPKLIHYLLNTDRLILRDIFNPGSGVYFRPFLLLSFWFDKFAWGLEESFMHLENVFLHLLNTLLVFGIASRVKVPEQRQYLFPLAAALIFALHPINAEAVNWISGRTDLLACLFVLLSVYWLISLRLSLFSSSLTALFMLMACLSKETAIFFLPAAAMYPFFAQTGGETHKGFVEILLEHRSHFLVFIATCMAFFSFRALASHQGDLGVARVVSHVAGPQSSTILVNVKLVLKAAGFYLKKLFVPFPLNFGIIQVSDLYIVLGVLLCILVVWLLTRRSMTAFFFLTAAVIACSALMIPLLKLTWTPLAERYMYIPSAFFALGITHAVCQWEQAVRFQRLIVVVFCMVLVIAGIGTAHRTMIWQDNLTLFQDTLRKSPGFVPAQNEIAVAYQTRGDKVKAAEVLKSVNYSEDLINYQYAAMAKSAALAQNGDLDGALAILNQVLKKPGKFEVEICRKLLEIYDLKADKKPISREDYPEIVRMLSILFRLTGDPFYQYRLGIAHMSQKDWQQARAGFQLAADKAPSGSHYQASARKLADSLAKEHQQ